MSGLLEDDDCRAERGQRNVQTAAVGQGPELWAEVLQVGTRGAAQEHVHVVVEALGSCAVYYDVRHGQHLRECEQHREASSGEKTSRVTFTLRFMNSKI